MSWYLALFTLPWYLAVFDHFSPFAHGQGMTPASFRYETAMDFILLLVKKVHCCGPYNGRKLIPAGLMSAAQLFTC